MLPGAFASIMTLAAIWLEAMDGSQIGVDHRAPFVLG